MTMKEIYMEFLVVKFDIKNIVTRVLRNIQKYLRNTYKSWNSIF